MMLPMTLYDYLDRPVASLDEVDRFLLAAMRRWVGAARTGRCACGEIVAAFTGFGVSSSLPDFGIAMMTLDRDGIGTLRFRPLCSPTPSEDEARLLALFAAARTDARPTAEASRRIAATFVTDDAVVRLATAAGFLADALVAQRSEAAS